MDVEELKQQKKKLLDQAKDYDVIAKVLKKTICVVVKIDSGGYRVYGYDIKNDDVISLGTSNNRLREKGLEKYLTKRNPKIKIVSRNKQINNSFKPVIADVIHDLRGFNYSYYGVKDIFRVFKYNYKLLCNLGDLYSWGYNDGNYVSISKIVDHCSKYCRAHPEESNLKKVFGLNPKNLRYFIECYRTMHLDNFIKLIEHGLSGEWIKENLRGIRQLRNSNYWIIKEVVEYASTLEYNSAWLYNDYLNMKTYLPHELGKDFPYVPKANSYEKLKEKHDQIITIYNKYRAQQRIAALKELNEEYQEKVLPKVKEFEYSDDNYLIVACPELKDLIYEGTELHHCVGSYTDSVGHGKQYILFLRKKEEPDKPFYTINTSLDNRIIQIHGFGNCSVTEEISKFIDKWAKKFKLNASSYGGRWYPR